MEPRHRRAKPGEIIEPGDRFPTPDERLAAGMITVRQHAEAVEAGLMFKRMLERMPEGKRSGAVLTDAQARRDPRFRVAVHLRVRACSTRNRGPVSRESHRGRPGHRRTTSTRAGPDSDEPEPALLRLAPPPKTIYNYAASRCPICGAVLLWADGRLVCASRSCPRWGRPA